MRWRLLMIAALLLCVLWQGPARAAGPIHIDPAYDHIDISTGFNGAELVIYGLAEAPGDIAVLLTGPSRTMVVRRKTKTLGAWMNLKSVEFKQVPSFYDYALSRYGMEKDIAPALSAAGVGLNALDFVAAEEDDLQEVLRFREALIRNKQAQGLFSLKAQKVENVGPGFFKARFFLPSNVPTGQYSVRAFLFSGDNLIAQDQKPLRVAQVGFSAKIYSFAYRHSLAYGCIAIFLALFASWMAVTFLRRD